MIGLIMAGGSGKRFWPLSRFNFPKQFLKITSDLSMIEMTFNRMALKIKKEDIFVVTAENQVKLVKENIPGIPDKNIIVEPVGMNTAPAIALSMKYLSEFYPPEEVVFIGGSDYEIADIKGFTDSLEPAEKAARLGNLVTFGLKPAFPSTGYGYVESGEAAEFGMKVKCFKEKPDIETARKFMESGNFYWNSGMFVWTLNKISQAYSEFLPKITHLCDDISSRWRNEGYGADISDLYSKMPKIPVDIGIMEQAENRIVIPVDYGWSDVGGWKSLFEISKKDENNNVIKNSSIAIDSSGNYVNSRKFTALIGVNNLVVVESDNVIMIADMNKSESVKDIVSILEKSDNNKHLI